MKKKTKYILILCSVLFFGGLSSSCSNDEEEQEQVNPLSEEVEEQQNKDIIVAAAKAKAKVERMTWTPKNYSIYFDNGKKVTLRPWRTPLLKVDDSGYWTLNGEVTSLKANDSVRAVPKLARGEHGRWTLNGKDTHINAPKTSSKILVSVVDGGDAWAFDLGNGKFLWMEKFLKPPFFDNKPLPIGIDTLHVLALGNSFTLDAIAYLHEMVRVSDIDLKRLVVYVGVHGGASLDYWSHKLASNDTIALARAAGDLTMNKRGTLKELLAQPWDVVCLQQNCAGASDYGTFNPALHSLIDGVRAYCPNPNLALAWQMAWSCWGGYEKLPFLADRYERTCAAMKKQLENDGIDILIPIGTAVENARNTYLQTPHDLTRDGLHIAHGVGRYVAAATWFESILAPVFRTTVIGNPYLFKIGERELADSKYETVSVTEKNRMDCQLCAQSAVEHPYRVTLIDETCDVATSSKTDYRQKILR